MRKVGKAAVLALMTPLTAAAITVGTSGTANAEKGCLLKIGTASITPVSGTVVAGSRVHLSATVQGMLAKAHLQVTNPDGTAEQVGSSINNGTITGDVTVSQTGSYGLSVVGNATSCHYADASFSVKARSTGAKPTPTHRAPSKSPTASSDPTSPGSAYHLPTGTGSGTDYGNGSANIPGTQPLNNNNSPFSLPSLAPNGSGIGFQYPTPDPQIAEPAAKQVRADDAATSSPIKWGQSIAAALVLLLLSAHFGMWSRRQRLAAEARAAEVGPAGKAAGGRGPGSVRRRRRPPITESATTGTVTSGSAETGTPTGADDVSPSAGAGAKSAADGEKSASGRGGYHGRRRRG